MQVKISIKYPSDIKFYSPESHWASFSAHINEVVEGEGIIRMIDKVRMAGICQSEPRCGAIYTAFGDYVENEKWGWQFKIDYLYEDIKLDSYDDKKMFLSQILTERQFKNLYETYQDPFEVIINGDVDALTKVYGIGQHTAERIINKLKSVQNMAPAYNFFRPLGVTALMITKLCETYGGAEKAVEKFKENPYIIADDIKGVGFLRADEIALKYNVSPEDPFRISSGMKYMLKQEANDEGSTWMTLEKFKDKMMTLLEITWDVIEKNFNEEIKNGLLYYDKENNKVALYHYYHLEENIKNKLIRLQKAESSIEISDAKIDDVLKNVEKEQGYEFTDEQREGIKSLIHNNVSLVVGLAGTGKTSIVKGAYEAYPYHTIIKQCAFSGQASKRINEATGKPSSTIHRLLGFDGIGFKFNDTNPLEADIVILDEISMVGIELFWSLIQAIPDGSKLVMLGDNGQLPPIGVGNLLNDIMNSGKINIIKLTKIHRQAEKSAIITTSQKIRQKKFLFTEDEDKEETIGELQDLTYILQKDKDGLLDKTIDVFMNEYKKDKNIQNIQIIVAQNQKVELAREKINKTIQEMINPKKYSSELEIRIKYGQVARVGDKIINRENHYDVETPDGSSTNIFNGSMGILKGIDKGNIIVDFFDEGEVVIPSEYYSGLELAYAITCHSSQGSQFKTTIVGFDCSSFILLSNEWLYTAITRAREKCYLISQIRALNMCVSNHKTVDRNTFLPELFQKDE